MPLKLCSWNVNGLRAILKKPEWDWIKNCGADILAFQETKASPEQIPEEIREQPGWHIAWDSSIVKKGYSGVSVFSRPEPLAVTPQLPDPRFQGEGRLLHMEYPQFHFFNGYFPNGGAEILDEAGKPTGKFKRVPYKLGFLDSFLDVVTECRKTKPVVICGDFNIAHTPLDLANPEANLATSGFLPEERDWLDRLLALGFVDSFRHIHGEIPDQFTWWSYQNRARRRNLGWRLDYFFVSEDLAPAILKADIHKDVTGSDHCPITLELDLKA